MMKELYDITELFKIFKMFLKSGPDFNLRRKNDDKWVKMAEPESSIYTLLQTHKNKGLLGKGLKNKVLLRLGYVLYLT